MREEPHFSIVIPTHNRPVQLEECLHSISRLDYPSDRFEVIVVDDRSEITPTAAIDRYRHLIDVMLLKNQKAGPAAARNTGAAHAKGRFLAFTDDDCLPHSLWLRAFAEGLQLYPDAVIGGQTINLLEDNIHSTASQLLIDYIYSHYDSEGRGAQFFASNNFTVSRKAFIKMDGFDDSFQLAAAEDRDFCDRWRQGGGQLHYAPNAITAHAHPLTFYDFIRQHFNYGRGAFHFHQLRKQRNQGRVQVEPASFYYNLLQSGWKQEKRAFRLTGLLFLSQIANAAGFYTAKLVGD
jgi:GT2 family glycosyltransferase